MPTFTEFLCLSGDIPSVFTQICVAAIPPRFAQLYELFCVEGPLLVSLLTHSFFASPVACRIIFYSAVSLKSAWGFDELQRRQRSGCFIPAHCSLSEQALPAHPGVLCARFSFPLSDYLCCCLFLKKNSTMIN